MRFVGERCAIVMLAATLLAAAPVAAQNGAAAGAGTAPADAPATADPHAAEAPAAPAADVEIRFSFQDASLQQVIDFFSRETGLPVVYETDVPEAPLTFHSLETYRLDEALRVLNIILQTRGIMLRVSGEMLYLQKLDAMVKEDLRTYQGALPESVTDDQIVINVVPLLNALAKPLADKLKEMVGAYGSVTPMEAQNSLVIVETAGKIRQLHRIIQELDKEDPQGLIRIFRVKHTRASELMTPLKALLSEKVQKYVIDQQGNQKLLEEESIRGLTISHDDRTNSIIAKGMETKIEQLEEALALLDVPETSLARSVRSIWLTTLAPDDAVSKLASVFAKRPEPERPTVIPLADQGKITIIGDDEAIAEAEAVLAEIDGGSAGSSRGDSRLVAVPLEHADPASIVQALERLMNARQKATVRLAAGPDGGSIIISGPAGDVRTVESILPVLDTAAAVDRDARLIRLTSPQPELTLAKALDLFEKQRNASEPASTVAVDYDPESRTATLVGSRAAIDRFTDVLRMVESNAVVERETRQYRLTSASPGEVAASLASLAKPLLQPRDGSTYVAPEIHGIDPIDTLLVSATPEQFGVIESLVQTLDRPDASDFQFKVVGLGDVADPDALVERAGFIFTERTRGREEGAYPEPSVAFDELTGHLTVSGRTESVSLYEECLAEARRLQPPPREGRLYSVEVADAASIAARLNELISTATHRGARRVPNPEIRVVEPTNSLYVIAEPAQHATIERFVRELDTLEPASLPPMRLLQVRAADAVTIAKLLRERYDARPQPQRREEPVNVEADQATNTLIVTAPDALHEDIRAFIDEINQAGTDDAERTTKIYPLKLARATDLKAALETLYPEPPMPTDRYGRPLPHLQEPREVFVSADANTNSLIIEAPAERMPAFDALVEQLDRVELPPQAELRTYHVETGDLNQIVTTLKGLKELMVRQPEDGSKPVEVRIEAEPQSRTLIVAGDEVTFAKVEELLATMRPVPRPRDLRVVDVVSGRATEIADRALALYEEQTADQPDAGEVTVEVDPANGALMVVADDEAMVKFIDIVNQLETTIGPPPDVRLVPLEHAAASEMVEFLRGLSENELTLMSRGNGPPPVFAPVDRINAVLVAAQPEQHAVIRSLIDGADVPETEAMPPLRILQLRTADATNLASALMSQYGQRSPEQRQKKPVSITADPNTNALIVAAHPEMLPEIESIVSDLNDTTRLDSEGREIRIFPLKIARADDLAKTIDEMFPEPPAPVDRYGRPMPHLKPPREVVVRADAQTNSLIVDAPVQRMAGFEELVQQLDRAKIADESEIRTYRVIHADLDGLADTLRDLADTGALNPAGQDHRGTITITTEPVSQSLVVSGPPSIFERVETTLRSLDVGRPGPSTSVRFFALQHARADSLAPMLREILITRIREDLPEAGTDADALLQVTADGKTNTLIISAPEAIMPLVEQLLERLDDKTAAQHSPVVKVVPLTFASAQDVASSLTQALSQTPSTVTGEPMEVDLIASPGSNALVMVGLPEDLARVEELLTPLDQRPAMDALDARTFALEYADAATVAPVLERLLTNQITSDPRFLLQQLRMRRGEIETTPSIQVEPDERTNSLIVSGTKQTVVLAETLVTQLDRPDEDTERTYAVYTPANADPAALVGSVRRVIDATRRGARPSKLELIAEPTSGTVVVVGAEAETARAVDLLTRWDENALAPPQVDFQIITLQNADATIVAESVAPLLRDRTRWPEELRRVANAGVSVVQPSVAADAAGNRVLVSAPGVLMPLARDLIGQFDRPRSGDEAVEVRVVNLTQARAEEVAEAVRTALARFAAANPGAGEIAVAAEPSSNSLVVTAPSRQFARVDQLIAALDRGVSVDQAQVRTFFLEHARAEHLAPLVEQLLAEQRALDVNQLPTWARVDYLRMQEEEGGVGVRVAADARLNAVVVSATPAVLTVAGEMISQLDLEAAPDEKNRREVRVLTIVNADAGELADTLTAMFEDAEQAEPAPAIRVNAGSNSLVVRATNEQFRTIERVASEVDRAAVTARRGIRLIPVDPNRAEADEVARTLERLLDGGGAKVEVIDAAELIRRRGGTTDEPTDDRPDAPPAAPAAPVADDTPDEPDSISLHTPAGMAALAAFAAIQDPPAADPAPPPSDAATDQSEDPPGAASTDPAEPAPAPAPPTEEATSGGAAGEPAGPPGENLADRLFAALQDPPAAPPAPEREESDPAAADDEAGADTPDVTIAVDRATNSLIVIGSDLAIDRVEDLAREVQAQLPARPGTVRYVGLPEEVDADTVVRLINETLRRVLPGNDRNRVAVIADPTNNAVIVAGNDADFEVVADLIAVLSQPAATDEVVVKVYPLQTLTAERAAESVRNLIMSDEDVRRGGRARDRQARRMRELAVRLLIDGRTIEAVFDPNRIRVSSDVPSNSLIVAGPAESIAFIDRYVEAIDQTPRGRQATLRLFALKHAEAPDLARTLGEIFQARFRSLRDSLPRDAFQPEFSADERTNTLVVTASPEQLTEVESLLERLDLPLTEDTQELRIVDLEHASPEQAASILERVVVGSDQELRKRAIIMPYDEGGLLLLRGPASMLAEADRVLAEIDRDVTVEFEVRTLTLERASARAVADAVQRFYDDRARIAGEGRARRQISIVGDDASNTLLIAAADEDYEAVRSLVEKFDSPEATKALEFKIYQLEHARAGEIESNVQRLVNDLTWNQGPVAFMWTPFGGRSNQQDRGTLTVVADPRLNALIVIGEGDKFDVVEQVIAALDAPLAPEDQAIVKVYPVRGLDLDTAQDLLRETFTGDAGRDVRRWWDPEPTQTGNFRLFADPRSRSLIVSASARQHAEVDALLRQLSTGTQGGTQEIEVLPVRFARARELADSLSRFLDRHAQATGRQRAPASIVPVESSNTLIVSATQEDLATIRDMLTRLDIDDAAQDRVLEIVALVDADPNEVARIIRDQFGRGGREVRVTPDARTRSLIINAPHAEFEQAMALIDLLDKPDAADETIIKTYALKDARAEQVVELLAETFELNARGETEGTTVRLDEGSEPVEVKGKIIADERSNSVIVVATPESIPVIETLITRVDEAPVVAPTEWRIIKLEHALAYDTAFQLRRFLRGMGDENTPEPRIEYDEPENRLIVSATSAQFEQIDELLEEIDRPSESKRLTKFVPLEFARAEAVREALSYFYGILAQAPERPAQINTRIVANPATNSLLITSDESEWPKIEALLAELDSEEYDASLQLHVLPLKYADATSVARAINEAFQGLVQTDEGDRGEGRNRNDDAGGDEDRRDGGAPSVLVEVEEWVRASAEPLTNSVIVSASRTNLRKIEGIVQQLDVAEFSKLPPPRLIPVATGSPAALAQSLNDVYQATAGRQRGRRSVIITANEEAKTLVVRCEDEEFEQIRTLAEALQQEVSREGLAVHVLTLQAAPAARVEAAVRDAFAAKAERMNVPFSIRSDAAGNALVVASTTALFAEVKATVEQLDRLSPAAGQGIFIIELEHVDPEAAKRTIETIGLHQPAPADSTSRLVTEPIKVSVLQGRAAIVVVANPVDRETIVGLVKAIDAEPKFAESAVRVVRLTRAKASVVRALLEEVLDTSNQQSPHPMARAIQEQVRRLALRTGDGIDDKPLALDLTHPVRLVADDALNALLIGSTPGNVEALAEVVRGLDRLPLTEPVVVQIFPLENIDAAAFRDIVEQLFAEGKTLGDAVGSDVTGVSSSMTGRVLADEVALAIDERTNTVIVAGKEESIAFVEVMKQRLDTQTTVGWLEPRILRLKHADATDLAETIHAILVEGATDLPQSTPLQRQIGKIRLARDGIESDIFQPMSRLVVQADAQLNALILVGTPKNLETIQALVALLDIPAASPDASIRIYPVEHASAARLAATVTQLFDQQIESKAIRPEDRVIVQADERTNALIVSTSPRSFAVLESLLERLDSPVGVDLREIRTIEVAHASAARLAALVQDLMDARLERLRTVQPETYELERATVVADPRTNSLLVAAGNESFDVVRHLVNQLDRSTLADASLVNVVPAGNANVDRLAETVRTIMERRYADLPDELRGSQEPLVLTDARSNSLLVVANPEDLTTIEDLVAKLAETPIDPAVDVEVITLDTQRAEELAPRLQRMMNERVKTLGPARTPTDDVSVEAYPPTNSLLVTASEENLHVIRDLIEVLKKNEAAGAPGAGLEVIPLAPALPADHAVQTLNELYVDEVNRTRGEGTIRITADERLNALLVNAPEADVARIRELLDRLGEARPATIVEIESIPLKSADPVEVVELVRDVLGGGGLDGRSSPLRSRVIQYVRQLEGVEGDGVNELEVSTAVRSSINLVPNQRGNTIVVTAPKDSMELIKKLIKDLDNTEAGNKRIETFTLENADAEAMAVILTDLFRIRRTGGTEVMRPVSEELPEDELGQIDLGRTDLTVVPDERQQLSITVDSRTNTLIVSGTPRYLDLVSQVVKELDSEEANERVVRHYPLKNAVAEEVARVVGEFVEEDQQKLIDTLGPDRIGSTGRLLEREVTIVGDSKSNVVLVSASPRYIDRVEQMIKQLDVDPPQVLIQVLLAEITLDASEDWGVGLDTAGFNVGDAAVDASFSLFGPMLSGVGVPNLSVASSDFDLLIRALQAQGRLQVLSNPTIMAANNEVAHLQVGEEIRVAAGSAFENGASIVDTEQKDLGVILTVEPSINPEGFVRMRIAPEISSLSERSVQITEDLSFPVILKRTADTVVTVMDGQTIVLGGLISDRYERRREKVPVLGDLPFVGPLFRSEREQRAKTELLIVLTPHVIMSPGNFKRTQLITDEEIDRLSVPETVKEQIRRGAVEGTGGIFDAEGNRLDSLGTDEGWAIDDEEFEPRPVLPPDVDE